MNKGLAFFLGALLTGLTAAALPARADQYSFKRTVDRSVPAAGAAALQVTGTNGNIHLYADGGSSVRIHAVLGARSADAVKMLDVRTSREGNTVRVEDVCPSTQHFFLWTFADCNIDLEVHYPRAMALSLASKNGNIAIDGSAATVSLTNDNGNIDVNGAKGAVSVKNTNGNVTIDGASANVSASNRNGNLDVTLDGGWHGSSIALSTNAGNVDLRVPQNFRATLNAKTRMGDVKDNAHLQNGPVTVTATTTFGDVRINRG